jgi:hypothetical protein
VKPRQRHKHYPTKLPHAFGYQGRVIHGKHETGREAKSPTMVGQAPERKHFNFSFISNFSARLRRMKQQTIDEKGIAVHFKNCITNHFYRRKDYAFLNPGFAILQERATRDRKIQRD